MFHVYIIFYVRIMHEFAMDKDCHFPTNCHMCRLDSKMRGGHFGVAGECVCHFLTKRLPCPYHILTTGYMRKIDSKM